MKLATTTGDLLAYVQDTPESVSQIAKTPFRYLDYSFYRVIYPGSPMLGDGYLDEPMRALEIANERGMRFVQAHAPNYNPMNPSADHEASMLAYARCIEICARLGIDRMVIHTGFAPECQYPMDEGIYFRTNKAFLEQLFPAMEKWNVKLLVENSAEGNMGKQYFFMNARDQIAFIRYCEHPLVGACWDTGHANMRGLSQYEELTRLGKYLGAIHFQDNFGAYDEHIAPFMGTLDLDAVMQALIQIGFDGPVTFEADNLVQRGGGWPHERNEEAIPGARKLQNPSLDTRLAAEGLLYQIGRDALSAYGLFEG